MSSKYADGLTHGHCRHCDASVILFEHWEDRITGDVECPSGGPHWPWRWPEPDPLPEPDDGPESAPAMSPGGAGRWVDPNSLTLHHYNFNEAAVAYYMANPNGRWDSSSGQPLVGSDGVLYNGAHRAEAARRAGRMLWIPDPSTLVRGRDCD